MFTIISNVLYSRAYRICKQTFANVDCVPDLGVMVDYRLKFDKRTAEIVHKAMSIANLILKSFQSHDRTLLTTAFCTICTTSLSRIDLVTSFKTWTTKRLRLIQVHQQLLTNYKQQVTNDIRVLFSSMVSSQTVSYK